MLDGESPMGGAIGISLALPDIKSRWRVNLIVHISISWDNFRGELILVANVCFLDIFKSLDLEMVGIHGFCVHAEISDSGDILC